MSVIANALAQDGYNVQNIDYPSTSNTIEQLAIDTITEGVEACGAKDVQKLHFVTHSLGGILVRYYLTQARIDNLGRVVMLGPPNQGSQVVDDWRQVPGYAQINGPAGQQLGTDAQSLPIGLGPVDFALGIIAGSKSFNPILSLSLPDPNDGKVSVENTKVEGMTDFIVVPHTHTFMMRTDAVLHQVKYFLKHGSFEHDSIGANPTSKAE